MTLCPQCMLRLLLISSSFVCNLLKAQSIEQVGLEVGLTFRECWVQIMTESLAVVTEVYHGFCVSLQPYVGIRTYLGHEDFVLYPF
jgi:hypothetical protein